MELSPAQRVLGIETRVWVWSLLALASLQLPALHSLASYAPAGSYGVAGCVATTFAFYVMLLHSLRRRAGWTRLLGSSWLLWGTIFSLVVVTAVVYPVADGLRSTGAGSDSDDAMKLVVQSLLEGGSGYDKATYLGNPISSGPGWALLWAPLTLIGGYPFLNAGALLACILPLHRAADRNPVARGVFLVLWLSSLGQWHAVVTGSDLPALGACIVALALLVDGKPRPSMAVLLALLLGVVSTARIAFAYLPLLVAFAVWHRDRRTARIVALVGTTSCAAIHAVFFQLSAGHYPPLHIVARRARLMPGASLYIAIGICALGVTLLLRHWKRAPVLWSVWVGTLVPLATVTFADLWWLGAAHLGRWSSASYLLVPAPSFLGWLSLQVSSRTGRGRDPARGRRTPPP